MVLVIPAQIAILLIFQLLVQIAIIIAGGVIIIKVGSSSRNSYKSRSFNTRMEVVIAVGIESSCNNSRTNSGY